MVSTIPEGLCQCGCGETTSIAPYTRPAVGWVHGKPVRFKRGHQARRSAAAADDLFWAKVDKTGDCWVWTGNRTAKGYGKVKRAGRTVLAHRVSWEIHNGPIPEGKQVCHHCDNPPCVHPGHLFVGTQTENLADMAAKGRGVYRRGSANGSAKLTEADVIKILGLLDDGLGQREVGEMFAVSQSTVSLIALRRIWTHVKAS